MAQLKLTNDILSAALLGFEAQKNLIDARIAELRQQLNGHSAPTVATETRQTLGQRLNSVTSIGSEHNFAVE